MIGGSKKRKKNSSWKLNHALPSKKKESKVQQHEPIETNKIFKNQMVMKIQ